MRCPWATGQELRIIGKFKYLWSCQAETRDGMNPKNFQHFYISICDESFDAMFKTFHQMLYAYAVSIVRDNETAKDIIQEVFLKLWVRRERILITSNLRSFLIRTTHNQCIDNVRAGKYTSRGITFEDVARRVEIMELDADDVVLDKIYSEQLQHRLSSAVDALPPRCREIFRMNREEGHSYTQIAVLLGVSHSTVKNQMMIAMRKLHEALKEFL